jgi:hypothetical protein
MEVSAFNRKVKALLIDELDTLKFMETVQSLIENAPNIHGLRYGFREYLDPEGFNFSETEVSDDNEIEITLFIKTETSVSEELLQEYRQVITSPRLKFIIFDEDFCGIHVHFSN